MSLENESLFSAHRSAFSRSSFPASFFLRVSFWPHSPDEDKDFILNTAYEKYASSSALIGSPGSCAPIVESLSAAGVDEIACFVDFGVDPRMVLDNLPHLNRLRQRYCAAAVASEGASARLVPLSPAQKQLWVLTRMDREGSLAYNDAAAMALRGKLDAGALRKSLQSIVDRHEALRTTIRAEGDFQVVHPTLELQVPLIDLSYGNREQRRLQLDSWLEQNARQAFDLVLGPLFRAFLLRLEEEHHLLVLDAHHTLIDGWSYRVIFEELSEFYNLHSQGEAAGPQPDPPMQYRQYLEQLDGLHSSSGMAEHEAFWMDCYAGGAPSLELPSERRRPPRLPRRRRPFLPSSPSPDASRDSSRSSASPSRASASASAARVSSPALSSSPPLRRRRPRRRLRPPSSSSDASAPDEPPGVTLSRR